MQVIVGPDLGHRDLAGEAMRTEVLGMQLRVCGYEDLVRMKQAAGRARDALALVRLRATREADG